jgi:hypothetical protein
MISDGWFELPQEATDLMVVEPFPETLKIVIRDMGYSVQSGFVDFGALFALDKRKVEDEVAPQSTTIECDEIQYAPIKFDLAGSQKSALASGAITKMGYITGKPFDDSLMEHYVSVNLGIQTLRITLKKLLTMRK